jgi:ribonuclease HI
MFVDGSTILDDQGGHRAAYAVVTIDLSRVLVTACLSMGTTSQKAELTALAQALTIAKDKTAHIYTDSKCAFLIAHSHAAIWKKRGFLTTRGTPVANGPPLPSCYEPYNSQGRSPSSTAGDTRPPVTQWHEETPLWT